MAYLSIDELQFLFIANKFHLNSRKDEDYYTHQAKSSKKCYMIDINTKGLAKYHINGEDVFFPPGSIYLKKPSDEVEQDTKCYYECYSISFQIQKKEDGKILDSCENFCFLDKIPTYTEPEFFPQLVKLAMEFPNKGFEPLSEEELLKQEILFRKLLLMLYPLSQKKEKEENHYHHPAVKKAIAFFFANADTPLTMKEVADYVGISEKYFQQLFKKLIGKTPNEYFLDIRLQIACRKLLTTNMTISEIAYESGFYNSNYFASVFKKRYHQTPSQFRKK